MSGVDNKLNEKFDIEIIPPVQKQEVAPLPSHSDDAEQDYRVARTTLRNLLDRGEELLNGIVKVADGTEDYRAYDTAGNLLKNIADISGKLMDLHRQRAENNSNEPDVNTNMKIDKAIVFNGTTADFQNMMKEMKNAKTVPQEPKE